MENARIPWGEIKIQTLKLRCLLPPKPQKIGIAQESPILKTWKRMKR